MSVIKRWNSVTEEWEVAVVGKTGPVGPTGATGPVGATGASGVGAVSGGTKGQVLAKLSNTDYDTEWVTAAPFKSTTTSYIWPAGMGVGFWAGGASLSSTAANSAATVVEVIFDTGNHNSAATSISFYTDATNNGAGAAMAVALYELTSQLGRTFLVDCGTALIGTTGVKKITFSRTLVPRYVAAHFALRNINTSGTNPTFASMGVSPPFRFLNIEALGSGNNSTTSIVSTNNTGSWPGTVTMGDRTTVMLAVQLGVEA